MPPPLYDPDNMINISASSPHFSTFAEKELLATPGGCVVWSKMLSFTRLVCVSGFMSDSAAVTQMCQDEKFSSVTGSCGGKAFSAVSLHLMPRLGVSALALIVSSCFDLVSTSQSHSVSAILFFYFTLCCVDVASWDMSSGS